MINRPLRFIGGFLIILFQYLDQVNLLYVLAALLIFEALSNWFIATNLMRLLKPEAYTERQDYLASATSKYNFEAERVAMITVAFSLLFVYLFPEIGLISPDSSALILIGFLPWAFGFALIATAFVNACPMVVMLKGMGFK